MIDWVAVYNDEGLTALVARFPDAIDDAMGNITTALTGNIGREAPVAKGRLQGSWMSRKLSAGVYAVWSRTAYRWFVNDGTRPHIIRPRNKRWLRFPGGAAMTVSGRRMQYRSASTSGLVFSRSRAASGGYAFAKAVNHPGTKPNPYIDRAVDTTMALVPVFVSDSIRRIL